MITKLLIANRGEIACRIIRTASIMGIETYAIYSDADVDAKHVTLADHAFYLGGSAPSESYLKGEMIIDIAKRCGADAIHPGYGFLSENAYFARQCEHANIRFIGPSSDAIDAMGSKSAAKVIMGKANVPLVPGYHGDEQSDEKLVSEANTMGYPLLIKAAFGGGGKGMRIVESESELIDAIHSARREASTAFGNDKLLMERYLRQPRHVEVQVFADSQGDCIYLSDRDCSIQRRHQKVIEEAPAPGLSDSLRKQMGEAAVAAAKAIQYRGAGTIEFLLDTDNRFYFMEMNTRLQVEHPVTEMVTGLDLVQWQLFIANGQPLPLTQDQVKISGHAFEARIYAEDPYHDFLPASGKLTFLREPEAGPHVRIDSGIRENDEISTFYDPMIAKLIVWESSREQALQRLHRALTHYHIGGLTHNIPFLASIATHPAFKAAHFSTDFIERYAETLLTPPKTDSHIPLALAGLYQVCLRKQVFTNPKHDPHSPWGLSSGFRLNQHPRHNVTLLDDNHHVQDLTLLESHVAGKTVYQWQVEQTLFTLKGKLNEQTLNAEISQKPIDTSANTQQYTQQVKVHVGQVGDDFTLFIDAEVYHYRAIQTQQIEEEESLADKLNAPMNGTVVTHLVKRGDTVTAGQGLLVMEAMKMEYTIEAPFDGVVSAFYFEPGELVSDGTQLVEVEASPEA
ncbi:acetyl-CoA carboxylase biotin carboxylase subunit [Shewanella surugensis]|uniref:Acetyl/propionyl/methylcrotonyl-CoA carboxylase subunit alpha n=1 Tax=Shewanella surugensis TaxID=212020 RepID=A0ABT0LD41_9GAMM|nr:acetyl/propionyl/methylcrotonyl-CoA carboxylase subunit alpha [Shewanella surugensis]MCL1125594.1 acetyl/propionyl/methylcrotonyl-CoA carboxylase subunit alpha [Shewanella surugensis]